MAQHNSLSIPRPVKGDERLVMSCRPPTVITSGCATRASESRNGQDFIVTMPRYWSRNALAGAACRDALAQRAGSARKAGRGGDPQPSGGQEGTRTPQGTHRERPRGLDLGKVVPNGKEVVPNGKED